MHACVHAYASPQQRDSRRPSGAGTQGDACVATCLATSSPSGPPRLGVLDLASGHSLRGLNLRGGVGAVQTLLPHPAMPTRHFLDGDVDPAPQPQQPGSAPGVIHPLVWCTSVTGVGCDCGCCLTRLETSIGQSSRTVLSTAVKVVHGKYCFVHELGLNAKHRCKHYSAECTNRAR